jgi:hypothetical protein
MTYNEKSRDKLLREVEDEVTELFRQILDYVQVACPTQDTYKALRSKVLREGNNCIRTIKKKALHYNIEFVPQTEEVIEIKQSVRTVKK